MDLITTPGGSEWLLILILVAIPLLIIYGLVKFILAIVRADKRKHATR
jgi:hypothetical protein